MKEWIILKSYEMMRVIHVVACPMNFNLLYYRGQWGGVLTPIKNDQFQVFLVV